MQTFDIDIKSQRYKNNGLDQYQREGKMSKADQNYEDWVVRCFGACWTSQWGG